MNPKSVHQVRFLLASSLLPLALAYPLAAEAQDAATPA